MAEAREHHPAPPVRGGNGAPSSNLEQVGASGLFGAWFRVTFAALGIRNYRLFYTGHGISLVGTWVRRTTMGWLVYQITGSMALLGFVMGLSTFPMFVLSPTAGALADRFDKRRIIVATQVVASLTSGTIALLVFMEWIQVWHLCALAVLSGIAFAFEMPARQAFVIELVGRDRLMNAIALNSGLVNLSRIFGPALAGVLMATVGMAACFALDAVSYVVVVIMLGLLVLPAAPKREPSSASVGQRLHAHLRELVEGFSEVRRNRRVRVVLSLVFMVGAFGWSFQTLMPAIAPDLLGLSEAQYGALMSTFGIGAIVGALFVARRRPESNRRLHVFGGVWTMAVGMVLLAGLGTWLGSCAAAYWAVSGALVLTGFGAVTFMSTANTLVQTSVEDRIRGRIMGIWAVAFGGSLPLGAFLAGIVAEGLTPYPTVFLFALVLFVASGIVYLRLPPRRRASSGPDADAAAPR